MDVTTMNQHWWSNLQSDGSDSRSTVLWQMRGYNSKYGRDKFSIANTRGYARCRNRVRLTRRLLRHTQQRQNTSYSLFALLAFARIWIWILEYRIDRNRNRSISFYWRLRLLYRDVALLSGFSRQPIFHDIRDNARNQFSCNISFNDIRHGYS